MCVSATCIPFVNSGDSGSRFLRSGCSEFDKVEEKMPVSRLLMIESPGSVCKSRHQRHRGVGCAFPDLQVHHVDQRRGRISFDIDPDATGLVLREAGRIQMLFKSFLPMISTKS